MDANISIQTKRHMKEKSTTTSSSSSSSSNTKLTEKQKEKYQIKKVSLVPNATTEQHHQPHPIVISDDSDVENDSPTTIKHNTITSLAALKEMLSAYGEPTTNATFFQHYFQNHTNSLPSRSVINCRRLSQCREEDEDEEKKEVPSSDLTTISGSDKSLSESSSSSKTSVVDTVNGPTHKFVVTKTKTKQQPGEMAKVFAKKTREYQPANTVHFPTESKSSRPSVYSIFNKTASLSSPHYDSRYFDSSLIEMKSENSSSSTIDCGSTEDIWVKRVPDSKKVKL